jgi:hypothetical protein
MKQFKTLSIFLCAFLVLTLIPAQMSFAKGNVDSKALQQLQQPTIPVTVYDVDGNPAKNATVYLENFNTSSIV